LCHHCCHLSFSCLASRLLVNVFYYSMHDFSRAPLPSLVCISRFSCLSCLFNLSCLIFFHPSLPSFASTSLHSLPFLPPLLVLSVDCCLYCVSIVYYLLFPVVCWFDSVRRARPRKLFRFAKRISPQPPYV
jgi:hypothetical protein